MSLDLANNLLNAFGLTVGISKLRFDDQGYCCLRFDNLDTHFQYDAANDHLVLFAKMGVLDEEALAEGCAWMMNANLFWAGTNGATLALQPELNVVFLQTRIAVQTLDYPEFECWLGEFVSAADCWISNVEQMNAGQPGTPAEAGIDPVPGAQVQFV